jgi:hypothetical protein
MHAYIRGYDPIRPDAIELPPTHSVEIPAEPE